MKNKLVLERIENLRGKRAYEEKIKLWFSSDFVLADVTEYERFIFDY